MNKSKKKKKKERGKKDQSIPLKVYAGIYNTLFKL